MGSTKAHTPPLLEMQMVRTGIRLIQRCYCTVRLRISFLVVSCVRWQAWGSNQVNPFSRDPVFYLDLLLINYRSQLFRTFYHFSLIEQGLLDHVSNKFGLGDGKGWDINHRGWDLVNDLRLSYTLVYCLLHCRTEIISSKTLGQASIENVLEHGYHLRVRA